MSLFNHKSSSSEKPAPRWFVVERSEGGAVASGRDRRDDALEDFSAALAAARLAGEGYSMHTRDRRAKVIGPDVHIRDPYDYPDTVPYVPELDDLEDPLLIGDVAVRAVASAALEA